MKSLTAGNTGLIKAVVLWHKNRNIFVIKVNDGPYWNQSCWNVSVTVVPVLEGCWCSSHSFVYEWWLTHASCEVCVAMCAFYFLGFGEGTWGLVSVEWPHYQGYFFCFVFFSIFSRTSISVNVKKMNKELYKLNLLCLHCFVDRVILEN